MLKGGRECNVFYHIRVHYTRRDDFSNKGDFKGGQNVTHFSDVIKHTAN